MNFKKLFIALASVLLVLPCLLVPASASTVYTISEDLPGTDGYLLFIPEGTYSVRGSRIMDDSGVAEFVLSEPLEIVYSEEPVESGPNYYFEGTYNFDVYVAGGLLGSAPVDLFIASDGTESFFYFVIASDDEILFPDPDTVFEFTAIPTVPSIQEFVTPEAISPVLDEIISLLPTVLIVIVSYIAIRKGIAYLFDFLHKS